VALQAPDTAIACRAQCQQISSHAPVPHVHISGDLVSVGHARDSFPERLQHCVMTSLQLTCMQRLLCHSVWLRVLRLQQVRLHQPFAFDGDDPPDLKLLSQRAMLEQVERAL
jgi:hypothetical protein